MCLSVQVWCQAGSDRDPVALCVRLRDVLTAVREFVGAHPTELVAVHVTSGEGAGDWRASVDWKACQSVILEVLRDKLVPEQMRDIPLGNYCLSAHRLRGQANTCRLEIYVGPVPTYYAAKFKSKIHFAKRIYRVFNALYSIVSNSH